LRRLGNRYIFSFFDLIQIPKGDKRKTFVYSETLEQGLKKEGDL